MALSLFFLFNSCTEENWQEFDIEANVDLLTATRAMQICIICQDAYIDVTWNGGTYQVYHSTRCRTVIISDGGHYNLQTGEYIVNSIPQGSGGGYSKIGGQNGPWTLTYPHLQGIAGFNTSLSAMDKFDLNILLGMYNDIPAGKKILGAMRSRQVKIDFKIMDPNIPNPPPAFYNLEQKIIEIQNMSYFDLIQLSEELIHAVQHQMYYGDNMNPAYKNYEFEAKAFYDIAQTIAGGFFTLGPLGLNQSDEFSRKYDEWLEGIGERKCFMSTDVPMFQELCRMWTPSEGYTNRFLTNYRPQVLLNFLRKR